MYAKFFLKVTVNRVRTDLELLLSHYEISCEIFFSFLLCQWFIRSLVYQYLYMCNNNTLEFKYKFIYTIFVIWIYLFISISLYLSVYRSVGLYLRLCHMCLSVRSPDADCLSLSLLLCLPACLSVGLLTVFRSASWSTSYLYIPISIHPYILPSFHPAISSWLLMRICAASINLNKINIRPEKHAEVFGVIWIY